VRRLLVACFVVFPVVLTAGCASQRTQQYNAAQKEEAAGDYDSAVVAYDAALKRDPLNAEYKLRDIRVHFEAAQFHVERGEKAMNKGQLEFALAEFQKAEALDPSSTVAAQDAQKAMELLAKLKREEQPKPVGVAPPEDTGLMSAPPQLEPLNREPLHFRFPNTDPRMIFEAIGQLAGISVIFDPGFTSQHPITVDLPNVTLEQALDAVALESGTFWKPVTPNVIIVAQDNLEKRRALQDEEVQTFYLHNTTTAQEITEVVSLIRQLLDTPHIMQVADDNAIVMRATPDQLMLASKIIDSIDKPKPEVVLQFDVLEAQLNHERTLGINPGQSASLTFTGAPCASGSTSSACSGSSSTGSLGSIAMNVPISSADYSLTLPGATLNALLTDSKTKIIQDPSVRIMDGATAKLAIGDKVPIATGSFQAGVGVTGTAGVSPLVNTQFTYQDVGVNVEVTPHIHTDGSVSLKMTVDVSSITGQSNIGGIEQPIIGQRKIEHEVTLRDGEVNILGGLITSTQTKSLSGWPGLASIPFLRYFFSSEDVQTQDDEVLIAITPHVVRMPSITPEDLRTLASGSETNVRVYPTGMDGMQPPAQDNTVPPSSNNPTPQGNASPDPSASSAPQQPASLQFQPASISMKAGDTMTIGLSAENVHDLYSIPLLLQYNPAVIQVEDVRNGGFLSGGTQEIAIAQGEPTPQGQLVVSATRRPNTPGISGTGTLFGIVIKAIAPGTSQLQVLQVNARDSQQRPIAITSGTVTIQVQ
jgi:general secretion pathway protein D